jgi:hypothetical protein
LADALADYNLTTDVVDAEAFRSSLSFELNKIKPMLASLQCDERQSSARLAPIVIAWLGE